ncbi:MAG: D-alanyl-D-alanine carboxypeptidase family protein [Clostridia bacterium]
MKNENDSFSPDLHFKESDFRFCLGLDEDLYELETKDTSAKGSAYKDANPKKEKAAAKSGSDEKAENPVPESRYPEDAEKLAGSEAKTESESEVIEEDDLWLKRKTKRKNTPRPRREKSDSEPEEGDSDRHETEYAYSSQKRKKQHSGAPKNKSSRNRSPKEKSNKIGFYIILLVAAAVFSGVFGFFAAKAIFGEDEKTEVAEPVMSEEVMEEESPYATPESEKYERVINRSYPLTEEEVNSVELREVGDTDQKMETNAAIALEKMIADLNDAGMSIRIQSTYRTVEDQEELYNNHIAEQNGNELKAATISAVPLTSEHQYGLAVDLSIDGTLTEAFASTEQGKWLKEHCAEYGFILRYLPENTEYTGIISEPWHFRYVGSPEVAKAIMRSGKSMEEYYGKFLKPEDIDPYREYLGLPAKEGDDHA